jgi:hypothetical protein
MTLPSTAIGRLNLGCKKFHAQSWLSHKGTIQRHGAFLIRVLDGVTRRSDWLILYASSLHCLLLVVARIELGAESSQRAKTAARGSCGRA